MPDRLFLETVPVWEVAGEAVHLPDDHHVNLIPLDRRDQVHEVVSRDFLVRRVAVVLERRDHPPAGRSALASCVGTPTRRRRRSPTAARTVPLSAGSRAVWLGCIPSMPSILVQNSTYANGALVVEDDRIAWSGPSAWAPLADGRVDADGRSVIPSFVDSHSHLVFAGDRADEFAARMAGARYNGGG